MKVAVYRGNESYRDGMGGFRIPLELAKKLEWFCCYFKDDIYNAAERADPELINGLEEMKKNGEDIGPIEIVEVPDDIRFRIVKIDEFGNEAVEEILIPRRW
jgi:hypothetical protein